MLRHLTIVLALFLTFSCDSTFDASRLDNDLAGTSWLFQRAETDDGNVDHDPTTSQRASIEFGERAENETSYEVSGYNGCNAFSGRYTVNGDELQFSQIKQTERACMEAEGRIEGVFNKALQGAKSFTFDAPVQSVKLRLIRSTEVVN